MRHMHGRMDKPPPTFGADESLTRTLILFSNQSHSIKAIPNTAKGVREVLSNALIIWKLFPQDGFLISVTYFACATGASTSAPLLVYAPSAGSVSPSPER